MKRILLSSYIVITVGVILFLGSEVKAQTNYSATIDSVGSTLSGDQQTLTISASGSGGCTNPCNKVDYYDISVSGEIQSIVNGASYHYADLGYNYWPAGGSAASWNFPDSAKASQKVPYPMNPVNVASYPNGTYRFCAQVDGSISAIWPNDYYSSSSLCAAPFVISNHAPPPPPPPPPQISGSGSATLAIYDTPDVTLQVNGSSSATIAQAASATLSWTPVNTVSGTSCTATGSWSGAKTSTPGTTYTQSTGSLSPGTYTYNLICTGGLSSSTATKSVVVTVTANAPTASITANGTSGSISVPYNSAVTIAWASTNATSCSVSPASWTGTSGSQSTGALTATTTYTLSCTGPGGTANASVVVNVGGMPDYSLSCSPATQTVVAGSTGSVSIASTPTNGFASGVTISSSISPATATPPTVSYSNNGAVPAATTTGIVTTTASTTPGLYTITFTGTGGGQNHGCASTVNFQVNAPAPTATITANGFTGSTTIAYNTSATIAWSSTTTTSCSVSPSGWTGTSGSQSTGNLTSTQIYSVSCTGPGGSATSNVTVTVGAAPSPTQSILCNGAASCSIAYNASATISWSSTNATGCSVSPTGWSGTSNAGIATGNLTTTTTYALTCTGPGGSSNSSVVVTVGGAPNFSFTCSPATQTVTAGSTASYSLTSTPTNGFASAVTYSGSISPSTATPPTISFSNNGAVPAATTTALLSTTASTTPGTYTASFSGTGGSLNRSCASTVQFVIVAPPSTADIQANGSNGPISLAYNGSATISWSSANASSCSVSPSSWTGTSGSQSTGTLTATTTYTLSCIGAGGNSSDSVTVIIGAAPVPTADVQANGSNGPISIAYNGSAVISWSSTNASSCSVSPTGWTGTSSAGLSTGNLTTSQTYTLTCTGPGGSTSDSVVVNVGGMPDFSLSCSPSTQTVTAGSTGSASITSTPTNGFASGVTISSSISPATATPPTISFSNNGAVPAATTTALITTTASTTPATYTITFTGTGGGQTHGCVSGSTVNFQVNAPAPTAAITANGTAGSISIAYNASATIAWSSTSATSCSVSPSGWTGTSGSQSTGALTTTTTYTLNCTGPGGSVSSSVIVNVGAMPDFTVNSSPATQTIIAGSITSYSLSTNPTNGFSSAVTFSAAISPSVATPPTISYSNNGATPAATTTAIITTTTATTAGSYTITFTGTGGGQTHSPSAVTLQVSAAMPTTSITANGTTGSVSVSYGSTVTIAWSSANTTSCSVTPTGWTGTSGSQVSSALTTTTTFTLNCSGPGGSSSANVVVNVGADRPASVSIDVISTCQQATVNWSAAAGTVTGYNVYRSTDGSSWSKITASPLSAAAVSYVDTPSVGSYYYGVTSLNGSIESTKRTAGPASVRACVPNITTSDKDIISVSPTGIDTTKTSIQSCNAQSDAVVLNGGKSFKLADVITFKINICNSGDADALSVQVVDTMSNLTSPTGYTYSAACGSPSSLVAGSTITFTVGTIAAGMTCSITYTATVIKPASGSIYRFQNSATINSSNNASRTATTPAYLFTDTNGSPDRGEIAP